MAADRHFARVGVVKLQPRQQRQTASHEPTIAAGFVRGLADFAAAKGADRAELLRRAAIEARDLGAQESRIPFAKYKALMHAAKALTEDPAFALHFGEAVDMAELSILGLIARASETFVEAMVQTNRFHKLGADMDGFGGDFMTVKRDGTQVWLVDNRKIPPDFPEMTEAYFARSITGIALPIDGGWTAQ